MRTRPPRTGFTLVEMLVVITIIGILVALLIPAISGVMTNTQNGIIGAEVQELSRAIEAYKAKTKDYPPDFSTATAVVNHVAKAYPRNTRDVAAWLTSTGAPRPAALDPAEALVFWLSMVRKNVRDPLAGSGEAESYFDFDETRLKDIDNDGWQEYYPKYGTDAPYVYFDGRAISVPNPSGGTVPTFAYAWAVYPSPGMTAAPARTTASIPKLASIPAIGIVRPYRYDSRKLAATEVQTWQDLPVADRTQWLEQGKFQIVSAGSDSHFGVPEPTTWFKSYPSMNYYSTSDDRSSDDNNIANFSELKTLLDSVP